jgi:hypothetical protein
MFVTAERWLFFRMRSRSIHTALLIASLLIAVACEQRRPPAEHPAPHVAASADTAATQAAPARPALPDTVDASRNNVYHRVGRDTAFFIDGQRYRLQLRAAADSSRPITAINQGIVGDAFAADSNFSTNQRVRGYAGSYTITLLDSAGRRVFRKQLQKPDFYKVAGKDMVAVSDPVPPLFIGCHAPSQTLAFTLDIGIPESDVWMRCVLLLGFDGQLKRAPLYAWNSLEGADCFPRLLPNGTVLTCQELIPLTGPPVKLEKPKATTAAVFMLTDTTLCTIYEYGEHQTVKHADGGMSERLVVPKQYRNAPNAFVLNIRGQVRQQFRFGNFNEAMGYYVQRKYVPQTHTYYLLDEDRGLYLLDKHNPTAVTEVNFKQMQRFRKPQRKSEVRFHLKSWQKAFTFCVDTLQPTQVRYQRIVRRDGDGMEP